MGRCARGVERQPREYRWQADRGHGLLRQVRRRHDAQAWEATAPVGVFANSGQAISAAIPGLDKNTYYCYRYMATNSMGTAWASESRWFATVASPLVDCAKGLVVHYTCDVPAAEYVTDDSGNGNHAWIAGTAHAGNWVAGKVDGAVAFDALGTAATCPSLSGALQDTYSLAFWLKVDAKRPVWRSASVRQHCAGMAKSSTVTPSCSLGGTTMT